MITHVVRKGPCGRDFGISDVWNVVRVDRSGPFPSHTIVSKDFHSKAKATAALATLTQKDQEYAAIFKRLPRWFRGLLLVFSL